MSEYTSTLQWSQLPVMLSFLSAAVLVAGAFFTVKIDIARLDQKVETLASATEKIPDKINDHETRITLLESRKQSLLQSPSLPNKVLSPIPSPQHSSSVRIDRPSPIYSAQIVTTEHQQQPQLPDPDSVRLPTPGPSPLLHISLPTPVLNILGGG